jgi:hypothetical protein
MGVCFQQRLPCRDFFRNVRHRAHESCRLRRTGGQARRRAGVDAEPPHGTIAAHDPVLDHAVSLIGWTRRRREQVGRATAIVRRDAFAEVPSGDRPVAVPSPDPPRLPAEANAARFQVVLEETDAAGCERAAHEHRVFIGGRLGGWMKD